MVIDPVTLQGRGFCDRLRLITFCAAVAHCRNDTLLYIREYPDESCPYRVLELLTMDGFRLLPWREESGRMDEQIYGLDCLPRLAAVRAYRPHGLTVPDTKLLELWIGSYRRLRPQHGLQHTIDALGAGSDCVGFHVRRTDRFSDRPLPWQIASGKLSAVERMSGQAIRGALHRLKLHTVYLASDNQESKAYWRDFLARKGYAVLSNDARFDTARFRQTSGDDFIVDLFSLSRCRQIVGTVYSGVVITASLHAGHGRHTFVKNISPVSRLRLFFRYIRTLRRKEQQRHALLAR